MVIYLAKVSTYAALNEVQFFAQEVFPSPSQSSIQTAEAWIVSEHEERNANFLSFDEVQSLFVDLRR